MQLALVEELGHEPRLTVAGFDRRTGKCGRESLAELAPHDDRVLPAVHLGLTLSLLLKCAKAPPGLGELSSPSGGSTLGDPGRRRCDD
jgi:hypothetical protein